MTAGCLDGVRVLELARFHAGPRGGYRQASLAARSQRWLFTKVLLPS